MLKSMVGKLLKEGNGSCQSSPAIEQSDLIKMKQFFDRSNAAVLQMEVWFNLLSYFALRGRETIRNLALESFSVSCDSNNKKFSCEKSATGSPEKFVLSGNFNNCTFNFSSNN